MGRDESRDVEIAAGGYSGSEGVKKLIADGKAGESKCTVSIKFRQRGRDCWNG